MMFFSMHGIIQVSLLFWSRFPVHELISLVGAVS
jgi:hypothetical protein